MPLQRRLKLMTFGEDTMGSDTAVKVAFASSDRRHVDQHFGAAECFVIHAVEPTRSSVVEIIQFGPLSMDGNEDKLAAKIAALDGCVAVYCQAVGASAVNQLRSAGVQPMKVPPGAQLSELIKALQADLGAGPSAWLARAIESQRSQDGSRFDAMEAEGWSE